MAYYFDALIVSELRKKDNDLALRELYKKYYPMIRHLVCSNSGTEQEAKDIYQETIIAFYESVQQPHFTLTCKIKTYLYAVGQRLWLKRLSGKKRFVGELNESFTEIEEEMESIEEHQQKFKQMQVSLHALGEPCRNIIEDFYINDLTMEDIRSKYGYSSADNAKNQKYKCLQRLKKIFFSNHAS
jgi:RNA polymerase sigma factor (sigma-70 family)